MTYLIVIVDRLIIAGWREGFATLWDRDILAFFLIGMLVFGLGLIGEYVGRIYQQVRDRPRFMIQAVLEGSEIVTPQSVSAAQLTEMTVDAKLGL